MEWGRSASESAACTISKGQFSHINHAEKTAIINPPDFWVYKDVVTLVLCGSPILLRTSGSGF